MKLYKHIFFDLDRTIWDFDASAEDSFSRMFEKYELGRHGIPSVKAFRERYEIHNDMLWSWYRKGEILKEVLNIRRFDMTLVDFGIVNHEIAIGMSEDYVTVNPGQAFLIPHAMECLEHMAPKFPLHLLTNGFQEVQEQKFRIARLDRYFRTVTTSEEAGSKKPEPGIFNFALEKAGCTAEESIIIGDDLEVDIIGARNIGMDGIYFNAEGREHNEEVAFEIRSLEELLKIF